MTAMVEPSKVVTVRALRFHFLLRQLIEAGRSQRDIAGAIGCHQTLVSAWADVVPGRGKLHDITTKVIDGASVFVDPWYFWSSYDVEIPAEKRGVVAIPGGSRPINNPEECDHRYFPPGVLDRARNMRRVREMETELAALRAETASTRRQVEELTAAVRALSAALGAQRSA